MAVGETEFEMVGRHIRHGEMRVARQVEIIADMQFRNQPTGSAENLLFNFVRSLRAHKAHLEQLTSN